MIREHETPRHYRFRHPIVRRAVYDSSGPGWRLAAHARAAAALKERGAAPRMEAHHVERSARLGDEEAISLLVEAASAAEAAAPLTAAGWFRAAVHLVPGGPAHDDRRLELMVRMAVALGTAGRSGESHAVLEDALACLPSDHPGRTSVVAFCAGLDFYLGRLDQGRGRLLAELDRLGDEPSLDRARIQVELAIGATFTSGDQELHDQALAALETCRAMREPLLTMAAAGILAHAEITLGRFQAAGPLLDEAEAAYAALDDHQLAERIDAMHWLATPAMELARFEDTVRFCERALVISRAAGRGHWLVPLMHEQAFALIGLGRLRVTPGGPDRSRSRPPRRAGSGSRRHPVRAVHRRDPAWRPRRGAPGRRRSGGGGADLSPQHPPGHGRGGAGPGAGRSRRTGPGAARTAGSRRRAPRCRVFPP